MFIELQEKESERNAKESSDNDKFEINIDKIQRGEDKRSSLIIENLPFYMTKSKLVQLLSDVGNINFMYIPYDRKQKQCLGFAFINMINYKNVIQVFQKLNGLTLDYTLHESPISVHYSEIQGKNELVQLFGGKKS